MATAGKGPCSSLRMAFKLMTLWLEAGVKSLALKNLGKETTEISAQPALKVYELLSSNVGDGTTT